jgi:hypothetical protein
MILEPTHDGRRFTIEEDSTAGYYLYIFVASDARTITSRTRSKWRRNSRSKSSEYRKMLGVMPRQPPRLNFVVQHLLVSKEALIGCFVAMSFSRSVVEVLGD